MVELDDVIAYLFLATLRLVLGVVHRATFTGDVGEILLRALNLDLRLS